MTNINIRIVSEEEIYKRKEVPIQADREIVEPRLNDIIDQCREQVDKGIIRKNEFCECIDTNIDIWLTMCCKGRTIRIFSQMKDILKEKKKSGDVKC